MVFKMKVKRSIEELGIYYRRFKGPHNKVSFVEAARLWVKALKLIFSPRETCGNNQSNFDDRLKSIMDEYFIEHPDSFNGVKKATYAWHNPKIPNAHFFQESHFETAEKTTVDYRNEKCKHCGRSREQVRYDNLPYFCEKAPDDMVEYTKTVIKKEEEKAISLIERAKKEVPKWVQKRGMSGETLSFLHKTHGFTLEIVGSIVDIPEWAESEYEKEMDFEKDFSRASLVKSAIRVSKSK